MSIHSKTATPDHNFLNILRTDRLHLNSSAFQSHTRPPVSCIITPHLASHPSSPQAQPTTSMATAASFGISRLLPLSSATTTTTTAAFFPTKSLISAKLPISSFINPLKLKPQRRIFSSSYSTTPISASLSVGSKLPDATLSYLDPAGEVQTTTIADLTKSKKAIFFAVPGAFTPTCSQKHLPGFVEKSSELKAKGVDVIACISVNDVFVMRAWKENLKIEDEVLLLSDGNLEFTKAIGAELDLSDKPVGLGVRSRRYSLLADDGVVKVLNLEEGGAFTSSGAEDLLKVL